MLSNHLENNSKNPLFFLVNASLQGARYLKILYPRSADCDGMHSKGNFDLVLLPVSNNKIQMHLD